MTTQFRCFLQIDINYGVIPEASLTHQHDLLQTQLQTRSGIMMMLLELKFDAQLTSLLQITLLIKPAGNQTIQSVHVKWYSSYSNSIHKNLDTA